MLSLRTSISRSALCVARCTSSAISTSAAFSSSAAEGNKVEVLGHPYSQPSRAVWWFSLYAGLPTEFKYIDLASGEHRTDEFLALTKTQQVPVVHHDGHYLPESCAALRYLAHVAQTQAGEGAALAEAAYPSEDALQRARIDRWMDWHHNTLRAAAAGLSQSLVFRPLAKQPVNEKQVESMQKQLVTRLTAVNAALMEAGDTGFLVGGTPTLADFCLVEEVMNTVLYQYDLTPYPAVEKWVAAMSALPHYDAVHSSLLKLPSKLAAMGFYDR
eukprot:PLAT7511.1.p1 GENE.PLAT7511.1~~PLAT7511.1.p1  ORF type:complete len:272 (-),score=51.43 PLAT7511.1:98-913(-)